MPEVPATTTPLRAVPATITPAEMRWTEQPRDKLIQTLQSSLYVGAEPASVEMVLEYCMTAGLNVMLKPVHIVPMSVRVRKTGNNQYEMRDVIMPGINHYRTQASRSGCYVGKTEPEFGPEITKRWGQSEYTFPEWCRITVKRKIGDYIAEFSAVEYWEENYATAARDKDWPNAMWAKRPRGQLAKCTEAQALRMAFPEFASDATAEEMEGKVIDLTAKEPEGPRAAIKSLDAFAGVSDDTIDTSDIPETSEAEMAAMKLRKPEIKDPPQTDDPMNHEIRMPAEAMNIWLESGDWSKAWAWWQDIVTTVPVEVRQVLAEEHREVLWAVYESDVKDGGPNSKAAVALSIQHGYTVPPIGRKKAGRNG